VKRIVSSGVTENGPSRSTCIFYVLLQNISYLIKYTALFVTATHFVTRIIESLKPYWLVKVSKRFVCYIYSLVLYYIMVNFLVLSLCALSLTYI